MKGKLINTVVFCWGVILILPPLLLGGSPAEISERSMFPELLDSDPGIQSPSVLDGGTEVMIAVMKDGRFTVIPVTVETGDEWNYVESKWGKGNQLEVDAVDFPILAETGLHSEEDLLTTRMITGKPVAGITNIARPRNISEEGFIAADEDIVSVLIGDNRIVEALGLTHPELARPLFHIWNMTLEQHRLYRESRQTLDIDYLKYNGVKTFVKVTGSKGWQESIFDDEVLGMYQFEVWRKLDPEDRALLEKKYGHLGTERFEELERLLTCLHTGEMVPYYIQRYGFYEGHTGYRADPVALSYIFGLRSLEKIEETLDGNLYDMLTRHHTKESIGYAERD